MTDTQTEPGTTDKSGITGLVVVELHRPDEDGHLVLVHHDEIDNIVTQNGDQYYGDRAAQIKGTTKTITAITNVTTAVVTTSAAHGYTIGDPVTIAGVTPAGYNGTWAVASVPSSTTFGIYVGTALGAGSAFGTSQGLSLGLATGMRLGTGVTAAAKTTGNLIGTYITASQIAFSVAISSSQPGGAGTARRIQYQSLWAAGTATNSAITESVITNETPLSNVTGTAADTISRVTFAAIDKQALDTLTITWSHDLLGA